MTNFIPFVNYFVENLLYYLFILIVLIAWDSLDFYLEKGNFIFSRSRIFGFYFVIRAFFAIVLMEITLISGLASSDNKIVLSFISPLAISTLLQNLVVNIGGNTKIDVSKLFGEFRERILFDIDNRENIKSMHKKLILQKRLVESKISTEKIVSSLHFYHTPDELKEFEAKIDKLSPEKQRLEYVKFLMNRVDIKSLGMLFPEIEKDEKTDAK